MIINNLSNILCQKVSFWPKLFSKALRKFFARRVTTLNIFERLFMIISLRSKKIRVIRHVKQIIWKETCKSLDFWKIHSQNPVGIWFKKWQKYLFLKWKFFSKALRKFFTRRMIMFNIFGRLPKIIYLRSTKNWSHTTRQTNQMAGNVRSEAP